MTIDNINVTETLEAARKQLANDDTIPDATRSLMNVLMLIITLMANRLGLNSSNSSKPPSSDPNRKKKPRKKTGKKPGGQKGHKGHRLEKVDNPDIIEELRVDKRRLPKGEYKEVGYESRQVFDIRISCEVTEFRAEILEDQGGNRFVAEFPKGVTQPTQYGSGVKAHAVYMSQFQMLPYDRISDYFADQLGMPLSTGTLFNFNQCAYVALESFETMARLKLIEAALAHADETGINVNGTRLWLHCFSTDMWTLLFPHEKRGSEATDEFGILPDFKGILCHDHWKPYFKYACLHALCNAHHLRELTRAFEQDEQQWAKDMLELLKEINRKVQDAGGTLSVYLQKKYRTKYRHILDEADKECPPPDTKREKGQRGRIKKSKSRNLLERLRDYEDDVLRFMTLEIVPFTNNQGENDLRMTKVQQKVSGCFRSMEGARFFCRIRSYLITCRKHDISPTTALDLLFQGKLPDFDSYLAIPAE
jgi:transposase